MIISALERPNLVKLLNDMVRNKSISRKVAERALWLNDKGGKLTWHALNGQQYRITVTFEKPLEL